MSAYIDSINKAITMMVDFIFEIAHTSKFDDVDFADVKKCAVNLLNQMEKEHDLSTKVMNG